jgi:hypothetical protein
MVRVPAHSKSDSPELMRIDVFDHDVRGTETNFAEVVE